MMEPQRRKRQQRKACDVCRRRKSRCDVVEQGGPCSVCIKLKVTCRSTTDWEALKSRPKSAEHRHRHRHKPSTSSTADTIEVAITPGGCEDSLLSPIATTPPTATTRRLSVVSDKWTHLGSLARSSLAQFFQYGIGSVEWLVFDVHSRFRIAYVGTPVSNLSHLVGFRQSSLSPDDSKNNLHYPYPPIRPSLPWKPEDGIWGLKGNLDIANDISCFPARDIRDSLVDAYFSRVNPGFPVIDETLFRAQYADPHKPPPLLLFQAVLLAGAHVCDHPQIASSRAVVKGILFRRASMLFHIRHECDRMHLMQAALLFTWHLDDADTVSGGSYYWLGVACRIGFGLGAHRDVSSDAAGQFPNADRKIFRRAFWTAFTYEVFSALEHGRPCMVSLDDIDQPALMKEDFIESSAGVLNENYQMDYLLRNIELSCIALDILKLNSPSLSSAPDRPDLASIDARLALWAMGLRHDSSFWSSELKLHYNLVLLHLHRNIHSTDSPRVHESYGICNDSAQTVISCLEDIISNGTTGQCHFPAIVALTAAGIHIANDVKSAVGKRSFLTALNALDRLSRLLRCAKEVAVYWPSAEAAHRMFEGIYNEFEARIASEMRSQDLKGGSGSGGVYQEGMMSPDWRSMLATLPYPATLGAEDQDWMNLEH
ncbi:fungal-specific transcription factor domain-containing protein [Pseudomassariella vexata]|uniref:Fungal-specific transcription factor domain-domain-containing protein n=1 Tax=Pseudomassariella vexata TaxID=1141098 RepID=A0A1Y2D935_9PEZI|nr:fungal-specific transcription factor domain-containing protein [Pseudomassariella vexata]ORY55684.1 fungal-specific transcription factor domain-domain-containing protein [Pseudomassariella vexata]